jgi:HAD superfamily hydrolase (TIGR01549 family)
MEIMMSVKAVLFDVGNVIIPWDPANLYNRLIEDAARRAKFLSEVVPMSWHVNHDAGVSFADNRRPLLEAWPDFAAEIMAYDDRFEEMLGALVTQTIRNLDDLHAGGVPLYALTNMPSEKAAMVFAKSHVFGYFRDIIVSGDEKLIKPDPAIFELTLRRIGHPASEVLFIDDSAANIAAAEAMGFQTHHFTDPDALRPRLEAEGLL